MTKALVSQSSSRVQEGALIGYSLLDDARFKPRDRVRIAYIDTALRDRNRVIAPLNIMNVIGYVGAVSNACAYTSYMKIPRSNNSYIRYIGYYVRFQLTDDTDWFFFEKELDLVDK